MLLTFNVKKQLIRRTDREIPVAKSENYLYAQFSFSEEWTGTKTAIFNNGTAYSIQLDNDNKCLVPWEVITDSGFSVSVFCGERITANVAFVVVLPSGYIEGQTPAPPSPTVYDQLSNAIIKNTEDIASLEKEKLSASNIKSGNNVTVEIDGADVIINSEGGSVSLPWTELAEDVNIDDLQDGSYVATAEIVLTYGSGMYDVLGLMAGDIITLYGAQAVVLSTNGLCILSNISGVWYPDYAAMNNDVEAALDRKQDTLTAGENITIENNVISATGGGATYTAGQNIEIDANNVISASIEVIEI